MLRERPTRHGNDKKQTSGHLLEVGHVNLSRSSHRSGCVIFAASTQSLRFDLSRLQHGGLTEVAFCKWCFSSFISVNTFHCDNCVPLCFIVPPGSYRTNFISPDVRNNTDKHRQEQAWTPFLGPESEILLTSARECHADRPITNAPTRLMPTRQPPAAASQCCHWLDVNEHVNERTKKPTNTTEQNTSRLRYQVIIIN